VGTSIGLAAAAQPIALRAASHTGCRTRACVAAASIAVRRTTNRHKVKSDIQKLVFIMLGSPSVVHALHEPQTVRRLRASITPAIPVRAAIIDAGSGIARYLS